METVKKTFTLSKELYDKLLVIKKEKSFSTVIAALQYCIVEAYERHIRNEKRVKKLGDTEEKLTVDEKRHEREETRCRDIATRLSGELLPSGDGFNVAYYKHSKHGSHRQVVPLLSLTEEMVTQQWFPSREKVEEYWEKHGKPTQSK